MQAELEIIFIYSVYNHNVKNRSSSIWYVYGRIECLKRDTVSLVLLYISICSRRVSKATMKIGRTVSPALASVPNRSTMFIFQPIPG